MTAHDDQENPHTFGEVLRHYRERAGLTQVELANLSQCTKGQISHLESGRRSPSLSLVAALEKALQLPEDELQKSIPEGSTTWLSPWLEMESRSTQLLTYQSMVVPGLLQRKDYARAIIGGNAGKIPEEIDKVLKVRLERQRILARQNPAKMWAILDETVIRRPVGSESIMRDQLEYLIKVSSMPHITIQVLPWSAMSTTGIDGGYVIAIRPGHPDTVYAESAIRGEARTRYDDVENLHTRHRHLMTQSLSPDESITLIRAILEEKKR